MKALFVGPLPPPMTGNALPIQALHHALRDDHDIDVINLSKTNQSGRLRFFKRIGRILKVLLLVWRKHKRNDVVYLSVAESRAGNARDLVIYLICRMRLRSVVIHMLGGAGMHKILNKGGGLRFRLNRFFNKGGGLRIRLNRFFISRLGAIVVEGRTQHDTFSRAADPKRIHIVPNFAEDYLFVTEEQVSENFRNHDPLRILFLSNMLYGKGHLELLASYFQLQQEARETLFIDFAGRFPSKGEERRFLDRIGECKNIKYHGSVSGMNKKDLYSKAHVFCLPTYYPYEGQPFCILEAYATGCVVITTDHSGIRNVFRDKVNGFEVEKQSVDSLVSALENVIDQKDTLRSIAIANLNLAKQEYTESAYLSSMKAILGSVEHSH